MKKILFKATTLMLFISICLGLNFVNPTVFANTTIPQSVSVVLETAVYKNPTLNSEKYTTTVNQTEKTFVLSVGTVLNTDTSFVDAMFYKVCVYNVIENAAQDEYGYVLISHTLDSTHKSPERDLDENATIKTDKAFLYELNINTEQHEITESYLTKDTKVQILDGYDKKKEFHYIAFKNQDGVKVYAYVKTTDLSVKGVNYSLIVAISTLIACAGIVGAVVGVKYKKKVGLFRKLKNPGFRIQRTLGKHFLPAGRCGSIFPAKKVVKMLEEVVFSWQEIR